MKPAILPRMAQFLVFGSLIFSLVFPACCLLALPLLLLIAVSYAWQGDGIRREVPPGILAIFLLLLTALGYGQVFSAGPGIDGEAILLTLSACLLFVPFYLPAELVDAPLLGLTALTLLFGQALVQAAGLLESAPLPVLLQNSLGLPALPARLAITAALTLPLVATLPPRLPAFVFAVAWLAVIALASSGGGPLLTGLLLAALTVVVLTLRRPRALLLFLLAIAIGLTAIAAVYPGRNLTEKTRYWLEEETQFRDYVRRVFTGITGDLHPEEAGIGLANLRRRLSRYAPDGHLEMSVLSRFPPPLVFPYAFGILFTLLFYLLLAAILHRLVRTLKRIPRASPERPLAAGLLAAGIVFCGLALVSAQSLFSASGTPFFFFFGLALVHSARPLELLRRESRDEVSQPTN